MKKTTLLILFLFFFFVSKMAATTYLVDNGNTTGSNKVWTDLTGPGGTVTHINLTTESGGPYTLTTWLATKSSWASGDQVWVAGGTYIVSTAYAYPANTQIYGGFEGTENAILDRNKGANTWDYTNETIIDGGMACTTGAFTSVSPRAGVTFDGLTLSRFITNVVLFLRDGATLQNCKFTNNGDATHSGGGSVGCYGSGAFTTNITGCYFYNNVSSTKGPGFGLSTNTSTGAYNVSNCVFESNNASRAGGDGSAINIGRAATGTAIVTVSNCVFKNNTASYFNGGTIVLNNNFASLKNCLVYGTTATPALYIASNGGNVYNCTFVNNTGGGARIYQGNTVKFYNTVFWGTDGTGNQGSGFVRDEVAGVEFTNCAYNVVPGTTPTLTNCILLPRDNTTALFVDPTNNNWQLGVGSSLLSTGVDQATIAGVPTVDILNVTRAQGAGFDIGAYEAISSSVSASTLSLTPTSNISILSGGTLAFDANASVNALTIAGGGKLTLSDGKTLTTSTLQLNSDAANGTATFVDANAAGGLTVTGTTNVQQYLSSGRNWYISSPVSGATVSAINTITGSSIVSYDEVHGSSTPWPEESTTLAAGKGYIVVSPVNSNPTISFSGTLTPGSKQIDLTRTAGQTKEGFNLIGNPYASYVNWETATKANVGATIWYRTKNLSGTYVFDTFNGTGTNNNESGAVTGLIPPMQAVWARVNTGQTAGSVTFNNTMRSHATGSTTLLKSKSAVETAQPIVRLRVSNGINSDEAIVLVNPDALNDFDACDAPKMTNDNPAVPEIYTTAGTEKLAINKFNSLYPNDELALGFTTGQTNQFTIKATEFANFEGIAKIYLKDKLLNQVVDLTDGVSYSFSSDVATTEDRFALVFKSADATTGMKAVEDVQNAWIYGNASRQIVVQCNGDLHSGATVSIYNSIGQRLLTTSVKTSNMVIGTPFTAGVYIVKVNNGAKNTTGKVLIY